MRGLNTPLKRTGFVILIVGLGMLAVGVLQVVADDLSQRGVIERVWDAVTRDRYAYRRFWIAAWGAYLTVAGLLFSFLYDATLGRLARWIMGQPKG